MVLALQIKASYMRYRYAMLQDVTDAEKDELYSEVSRFLWISNILSLFQVYNQFIIYLLTMWWLKSKQQIHKDETLITTGYYKSFAIDCFFVII